MNPTTMSRHSNGAPVASTAEFSSYAIVHRDHAGFVIGSSGATVKDIAAKTNTWIHIQPVNEFSFGHPWFLIKGRSEDGVAKAHHYIMTISNEAESRNPRWSMHLTVEDLKNIDEFYDAADKTFENVELWEEYIIATHKETDRVSTFNAMLTDFECKDLDARIDEETSVFLYNQLPPCTACEQGIENQQGHYGECIPNPYDTDQTVRARVVCQLEHPPTESNFWSDYEKEAFCFEHHNAENDGVDVNCNFCYEKNKN